ncbi:hypothetical protein Tco_1139107 [Tanacetum coccineum]
MMLINLIAALKNDWFKQPPRPSTLDPEWNKYQVVNDQPVQPWFNNLLSAQKDPLTFDELMATPLGFSNFSKNHPKLDKITKADLVGPFYNLLKGTCQSSIELEYNMEECFKALTNRLDWENPKGDRCPFDLSKPLPLKVQHKLCHIVGEVIVNLVVHYVCSPEVSTTRRESKMSNWAWKVTRRSSTSPNIKRTFLEFLPKNYETFKKVRDTLHHRLHKFSLWYNNDMARRKWTDRDQKRSIIMVDLIDMQMLERQVPGN